MSRKRRANAPVQRRAAKRTVRCNRLLGGRSSQGREKPTDNLLNRLEVRAVVERRVDISTEVRRHLRILLTYDQDAPLAFGADEVASFEDNIVPWRCLGDRPSCTQDIVLGEQEHSQCASNARLLDFLKDRSSGFEVALPIENRSANILLKKLPQQGSRWRRCPGISQKHVSASFQFAAPVAERHVELMAVKSGLVRVRSKCPDIRSEASVENDAPHQVLLRNDKQRQCKSPRESPFVV